MPRFVSKDGKHSIETSHPAERIQLLAQGYREQKARTQAVKQVDAAPKGGDGKWPATASTSTPSGTTAADHSRGKSANWRVTFVKPEPILTEQQRDELRALIEQ